jgi:hypothetical protein
MACGVMMASAELAGCLAVWLVVSMAGAYDDRDEKFHIENFTV